MPDDRRDLDSLFRADLDRIDLPPAHVWVPGARQRVVPLWRSLLAVPAASAVIALALAVAFLMNVARMPPVATSPSPTPLATASAAVSVNPTPATTPTEIPSERPTPLPTSRAVTVAGSLPASGQWAVFLTRSWNMSPTDPSQGVGPARLPTTDAIRAVPLSASATTQRDTIALLSFTSWVDGPIGATENVLREQFSPDGHKLVLSVISTEDGTPRAALVVVDLIAGTAVTLINDASYDDVMPAWDPAGDDIAFARRAIGGTSLDDAGVWVIRADGSGLRRVLAGAGPHAVTFVFNWNANGTGIAIGRGGEGMPYQVVDAKTGALVTVGDLVAGPRERSDWRAGSRALVAAMGSRGPGGGGAWSLVTADSNGGGAKAIVTDDVADGSRFFRQPRWRPGSDEMLFMRTTIEGTGANAQLQSTLLVTDANGRAPRAVKTFGSGNGAVATWTPDGRDIVYLQGLSAAGSLHLISPDGSNDRLLQAYGGIDIAKQDWLDLAVLSL